MRKCLTFELIDFTEKGSVYYLYKNELIIFNNFRKDNIIRLAIFRYIKFFIMSHFFALFSTFYSSEYKRNKKSYFEKTPIHKIIKKIKISIVVFSLYLRIFYGETIVKEFSVNLQNF